ncbi:mitochondrial tRNA methylthiotransferase CDK5RAP1-like isoform X2 [Simochromis diagramma]|uniref:mitochondrial tRNA methylthiotransferase CDK5RAP1-like isoform X2 n=1 Tax=Simochromis diagramma TaxID=43689 RepID=UPI001A7EFFE0|nr:mitochondrial tRNA methylthiotransferase CDK5RAP1-like isoform X2 [Simochromis diagramma]
MEYLRTLKPIFTVTQHWPPLSCIQARYCSRLASAVNTVREKKTVDKFKSRLSSGPSFQDFVKGLPANRSRAADEEPSEKHDYLSEGLLMGNSRKVYFETYGCQMNVNDTEIAWSILQKKGYQRTAHLSEADVVLLVTCSVREKAEQTIWNRLQQLTAMKRKRLKTHTPMKIGILVQ